MNENTLFFASFTNLDFIKFNNLIKRFIRFGRKNSIKRLIASKATAITMIAVEEIEYLFIPTIKIEIMIREKTIMMSNIRPIIKVEVPISTGILNFLFKT